MNKIHEKAYVLLSGGQDSFVTLIWAQANFDTVETVSIKYNQRHSSELFYASQVAEHFKAKHIIYDIGTFFNLLSNSSLLQDLDHNTSHPQSDNLPSSFVPNRNGVFLTVIANHAFLQNEKRINLLTGTCETDFSGYPDCRDTYIKAKTIELSLGLDRPVNIYTPLMWKNKAQIFEMASKAGKLNELIQLTLSCYNGVEIMNEWGRGCGNCPACNLRKKGYEEFLNY